MNFRKTWALKASFSPIILQNQEVDVRALTYVFFWLYMELNSICHNAPVYLSVFFVVLLPFYTSTCTAFMRINFII